MHSLQKSLGHRWKILVTGKSLRIGALSMTALTRVLYPYGNDNYGVLLHCSDTSQTACVDCGDAAATQQALSKQGWNLTDIWVTHHHGDHTAGVMALKTSSGAKVTGPNHAKTPIDGVDEVVDDGDVFDFAGRAVQVIHTPGHTLDMMNFYLPADSLLFSGDTLFTMGCGRLFEGDAPTMWKSLLKLAALPKDTVVYGSHEYTLANAAFAVTVDPDNQALQEQIENVKRLRENDEPTVPTSLAMELQTNPFLRADNVGIRTHLDMNNASDAEVFAEIRRRKDRF